MNNFVDCMFPISPISVGEICILCKESFTKNEYEREYICPTCKKLWKILLTKFETNLENEEKMEV